MCVLQVKTSVNFTDNIYLLPNNVRNTVTDWSTADHQPMRFPVGKQIKHVLNMNFTYGIKCLHSSSNITEIHRGHIILTHKNHPMVISYAQLCIVQ